jgi:hypothetical protein
VIVAGMTSEDIPFVAEMFASHPELHGQTDGLGIHPYGSGVQAVITATIEVDGAPKPSCVAQVVYRYYA